MQQAIQPLTMALLQEQHSERSRSHYLNSKGETHEMRRRISACVLLLLAIALMNSTSLSRFSGAVAQSTAKQVKPPASDLIDINSATVDKLKSLPGIGDAYAQKIVAGRPYTRKDQLVQKKIIPQATYNKIAPMIIAKQSQ
jgi:competence protein ComEA